MVDDLSFRLPLGSYSSLVKQSFAGDLFSIRKALKMHKRRFKVGLGWAVVIGFASALGTLANASEPWGRIEEDWELQLQQPDPATNSPQLSIYLTPDAEQPSHYFQLQLNHAADANFSGGGFRVSAARNDEVIDEARSESRVILNHPEETIRWTNVMASMNGEILFAIKNGTSVSWGEFGGPEYLLRIPAEEISDLRRYTPRRSAADVDVGFGKNRVQALKLLRVRAYRTDGSVVTLETDLNAL